MICSAAPLQAEGRSALPPKSDAPDGQGVPWLLLDVVQASGKTLSNIKQIQRVDTVGGKAPATAPSASEKGQEKRVEYSATYKFYCAK